MRLLELFSGTGSVRKAVGETFDEVVSIDILQKFNPTECCDILNWDYKKYPVGYFDAIWASPPCTEYSKILYGRPNRIRDISGANSFSDIATILTNIISQGQGETQNYTVTVTTRDITDALITSFSINQRTAEISGDLQENKTERQNKVALEQWNNVLGEVAKLQEHDQSLKTSRAFTEINDFTKC
jgi:hypothetical protein